MYLEKNWDQDFQENRVFVVFNVFFTVFEHDYVARLDRKTTFYMYLEKFGIKIFQKKNRFLPFLTFLYRFVMPTTPIVGLGPKNVFKLIFYDIPS